MDEDANLSRISETVDFSYYNALNEANSPEMFMSPLIPDSPDMFNITPKGKGSDYTTICTIEYCLTQVGFIFDLYYSKPTYAFLSHVLKKITREERINSSK